MTFNTKTNCFLMKLCSILVLLLFMFSSFYVFAEDKKPDEKQAKQTAEKLDIEMSTKLLNHEVYVGDEIGLQVTFKSDKAFGADILGRLPLGDFDLKDRDMWRGEEEDRFVVRHNIILLSYKTGNLELPQITFVLKRNKKQEERKNNLLRVKVKSLLQEEAMKIAIQQQKDKSGNKKDAKDQKQQPKVVDPRQNKPIGPTFNVPPTQGGQGQHPNMPPNMQGQIPPNMQNQPRQQQGEKIQLQPRDVKDPVQVIVEDYLLLYVLGAILGIIVVGLLLWWWFGRKKEVVEEKIEYVDLRPADEIAFTKLDKLELAGLIAKREIKEFHLQLSEIMREYFGNRYNLDDALSLTTDEVALRLSKLYLKDLSVDIVTELLGGCDLVLFAKDKPVDEQCFDRLEKARLIVKRTREEKVGVQ